MPEPRPPSDRELLEQIAAHLSNLDRRDRWRTISTVIHGIINLAMLGFVLWSTWLVYEHTDDILRLGMEYMGKQMTQGASSGYEEFMNIFK